jgi:hypothetical protein
MPIPGIDGWYIYWDVVIRLVTALSGPVLAIVALFAAKPVAAALLQRGGSIGAGGFSVQLNGEKVDEAALISIEETEDDTPAQEQQLDREAEQEADARDSYDRIMDGWDRISEAFGEVFKGRGLGELNRKDYSSAIDTLLSNRVISSRFATSLRTLLDVRNHVKVLGQARFKRANLTEDATEQFYKTASRLARELKKRAVNPTAS